MPQPSLALLAAGLLSGLVFSWPGDLAAPQAHRLAAPAGAHRIAARGEDDPAEDALAESSVADDLDDCAPFVAIGGDRALDFDTAHGKVMETAAPAGAPGRGAPPLARVGTFSTVDQTGRVVVTFGGVRRDYTLIIPAEGTQCILALGAPNAVNLERSWFGQMSDEPDSGSSGYQHATAPLQGPLAGPRLHRAARLGAVVG